MGHLVNPISYRLYNTRYWNNNWFVFNKFNYSYIFNQDILIKQFLKKFFTSYLESVNLGVILVNVKVFRWFANLNLYIYIHDSFLDLLFFDLKRNLRFIMLKRFFRGKFIRRYKDNNLISRRLFKSLRKKLTLKYSRKLFFLFLKNKVLRLYWNYVKLLVNFFLSKLVPAVYINNIYILGLSKRYVNASIISEFFFIRLQQYYTIWEVLKNINYLFKSLMRKKRKVVDGYKITCSGRFSRKQRTTYSWKVFGSLALSTTKSKLDYSYRSIALKYSLCTVKVWVRLSKNRKRSVDFVV